MRMAVLVMGSFSPGYMYFGSPVVITVLGLGLGLVMPAGAESLEVVGLLFACGEAPEEACFDGFWVL